MDPSGPAPPPLALTALQGLAGIGKTALALANDTAGGGGVPGWTGLVRLIVPPNCRQRWKELIYSVKAQVGQQ